MSTPPEVFSRSSTLLTTARPPGAFRSTCSPYSPLPRTVTPAMRTAPPGPGPSMLIPCRPLLPIRMGAAASPSTLSMPRSKRSPEEPDMRPFSLTVRGPRTVAVPPRK
jgi:hypothetical protein